MSEDVARAVEELKAQGIAVAIHPSSQHADVYVLTVPDGEKYEFQASGLIELRRSGRLNLEGLQSEHFAKKGTPNFHNPPHT